jgi:hypothetical protein
MVSAQRPLGRIEECSEQSTLVHGQRYIATSRIYEAQRIAVELPPAGKPKAAMISIVPQHGLNVVEFCNSFITLAGSGRRKSAQASLRPR